jgi:hypothetical protein
MSTSTSPATPQGDRRPRLYLVGLFLLGVAVQFYLAGRGAFHASDYDAHKTLGNILHGISLLILVVSVALPATRNRVDIGLAAVLFILMSIQVAIGTFEHPELGAFHPLNALLITGAVAGILSRDRRLGAVAAPTTAEV